MGLQKTHLSVPFAGRCCVRGRADRGEGHDDSHSLEQIRKVRTMGVKSKIEWTKNTWNPVTGCTKVSDGCKNCYAATLAKRLKLMGNRKYVNGFDVTLHDNCLEMPLHWKKPALIFVNSKTVKASRISR
ncbi:phage protein Gp37/Gp68 [Peptococcaceae bacterium CEB3]|nr:phage protein Gp37/Gp68 [Peptococcaceae bacterium CEB3]